MKMINADEDHLYQRHHSTGGEGALGTPLINGVLVFMSLEFLTRPLGDLQLEKMNLGGGGKQMLHSSQAWLPPFKKKFMKYLALR